MTTWEQVHAGCVVLGHDGKVYGVSLVEQHPAGPVIELVYDGAPAGRAQPPPGTPITVLEWPETSGEARTFALFTATGLDPQVIRESYQP